MTLKEYFTKSISNLINLINSNNDVKNLTTIMIFYGLFNNKFFRNVM